MGRWTRRGSRNMLARRREVGPGIYPGVRQESEDPPKRGRLPEKKLVEPRGRWRWWWYKRRERRRWGVGRRQLKGRGQGEERRRDREKRGKGRKKGRERERERERERRKEERRPRLSERTLLWGPFALFASSKGRERRRRRRRRRRIESLGRTRCVFRS